jgi:predicted kinase
MVGEGTPAPLLVIICGKPATGKTTLGARLAADLALPFFNKDTLKETLFDTLGVADRAWSRRLGGASLALLRVICAAQLAAGQSLVIEANFSAELDAPFYQSLATRHGAQIAQVCMTAEPATLVRRFEQRAASAERHPGHVEQANMDEFRDALLHSAYAPLPLDGACFVVDTTDFAAVAYDRLVQRLRMVKDGAIGPA